VAERQKKGDWDEIPAVPSVDDAHMKQREWEDLAWSLADAVAKNDPEEWRKDEFGAWIRRSDHRRRDSEFGWEILHREQMFRQRGKPMPRAMHWRNFCDRIGACRGAATRANELRNRAPQEQA